MDQNVGRLEVAVTNLRQLKVVESLEELENEDFSGYRRKRGFKFSLFLDEKVETARYMFHNDGEIAFLSQQFVHL